MDGPDSCVPDRDTQTRSLDDFYGHYGGPLGSQALIAGAHLHRSASRKRLSPESIADDAGQPLRGGGSSGRNSLPRGQLSVAATNTSVAAMLLGVWASTTTDCSDNGHQALGSARLPRSPSVPLGLSSTGKCTDAASKLDNHICSGGSNNDAAFHSVAGAQHAADADTRMDSGTDQQVPVLSPKSLAARVATGESCFPDCGGAIQINTSALLGAWADAGKGPSAASGQPYSMLLSGPGFGYSDDDDDLSNDISIGSVGDGDSLDGGFMIDSAACTNGRTDAEDAGAACGSSRGGGAGGTGSGALRGGVGGLPACAGFALARSVGSAHSGSGGARGVTREASGGSGGGAAAAGNAAAKAAAAPGPASPGLRRPATPVVEEGPGGGLGGSGDGMVVQGPRDGAVVAAAGRDECLTGVGSTPVSGMQSCDGGLVVAGAPRPNAAAAWVANDTAAAAAEAAVEEEEDNGEPEDEMLFRSGSSESVGSAAGAAGAPAPAPAPAGSGVHGGGGGLQSDLMHEGAGGVAHGSFAPTEVVAPGTLGAQHLAFGGDAGLPPFSLLPLLCGVPPLLMGLPLGLAAANDGLPPGWPWIAPAAAAAAGLGGFAPGAASGAEHGAEATGSVVQPPPLAALPSLLPPETYLGFIAQLVESVRMATQAVTTHAGGSALGLHAGCQWAGLQPHMGCAGVPQPQYDAQYDEMAAALAAAPPLVAAAAAGPGLHLQYPLDALSGLAASGFFPHHYYTPFHQQQIMGAGAFASDMGPWAAAMPAEAEAVAAAQAPATAYSGMAGPALAPWVVASEAVTAGRWGGSVDGAVSARGGAWSV